MTKFERLEKPECSASPMAKRDHADISQLRIALFSGNYNCVRDGANRAQNELVRYLIGRGAAVRVYSPTCDQPAFEPAGDLVSVPSVPMPFGRNEYRVAWRIPRSVRADITAFAPSLFHISLPFLHGRSALALARRMKIPALAAMHTRFETYPRYYGWGLFEQPLIAALRRFYRACDKVVAPCESAAQTMELQGMGNNIGIWSRGVDQDIFSTRRRDMAWRRTLGFGDDETVIAYLGRLVLEKGLGDFVEVVGKLRRTGVRFRVLVIGDGPAQEWFAAALGDAVFVGFQRDEALGRALASADLLLNPSQTEAFGNVSLEAMSCSLPVVAAQAPGNSSLVLDGVTGALIMPGDVAGYAAAIHAYIANPALRRAHGRNARHQSDHFSWDNANAAMAANYLDLLESRADAHLAQAALVPCGAERLPAEEHLKSLHGAA